MRLPTWPKWTGLRPPASIVQPRAPESESYFASTLVQPLGLHHLVDEESLVWPGFLVAGEAEKTGRLPALTLMA